MRTCTQPRTQTQAATVNVVCPRLLVRQQHRGGLTHGGAGLHRRWVIRARLPVYFTLCERPARQLHFVEFNMPLHRQMWPHPKSLYRAS